MKSNKDNNKRNYVAIIHTAFSQGYEQALSIIQFKNTYHPAENRRTKTKGSMHRTSEHWNRKVKKEAHLGLKEYCWCHWHNSAVLLGSKRGVK